jgi:cyclophilin family peptidyl-prolyl cis-trans isomerase
MTIDSVRPVTTFAPIDSVPVSKTGLSNTVGTVSLALAGGDPNSGTSSFFINLADNSFLDAQGFTVFAQVSDLTVVKQIMALPQKDRRDDPLFGADPNDSATFATVPLQSDGFQVLIKRAFVESDALNAAQAVAGAKALMAESAAGSDPSLASFASDLSSASMAGNALAGNGGNSTSPLQLGSSDVPEPTSLMLAAFGFGFYALRRRR